MMFGQGGPVKVFVATRPVDFRKGIDGLALAVQSDLNPIEMTFSKLKTLIRKAAARTYDLLWQTVGHVCDLFNDEECYNCFKATGYRSIKRGIL